MKVSVVMATYNGERYVQEQLKSIVEQTTPPDELVVSDDGSVDRTVSILREFVKVAPFSVRIFTRDSPLGFASNFASACLHADGDVIILSDQDDVWLSEKIECTKNYFLENPEKELVLHDITVCDADMRPLVASYFSYLVKENHDPRYLVKGCATAIRRGLRDRAYPLPLDGRWTHDCRVHSLSNLSGTRGLIERVLSKYRVHSSNTSGYALPKNNWKGVIAAFLKKKSLDRSTLPYTTIQHFSLRDVSDSELIEFYSAHLQLDAASDHFRDHVKSDALFSLLKEANGLLNRRSQISRLESRRSQLKSYIRLAAEGGYAGAGGCYALLTDVLRILGRPTKLH